MPSIGLLYRLLDSLRGTLRVFMKLRDRLENDWTGSRLYIAVYVVLKIHVIVLSFDVFSFLLVKRDMAYALTPLCIHSLLCTVALYIRRGVCRPRLWIPKFCCMCMSHDMCQVMRLTIYFNLLYDDISMLFHSLTFIILCGSEFSSILQNGALCFFENFSFFMMGR
jgi:hypothetical protein